MKELFKVSEIILIHLNYQMDVYRCKFFDGRDFFSDEMLKYLFDKKDRYSWLVMQDGEEHSCGILCGKATKIGNEIVSKFVQGKHFHWVIWWRYLHFAHSSLNKFLKIWEKDWNDMRFNPEPLCDCGPLYTS